MTRNGSRQSSYKNLLESSVSMKKLIDGVIETVITDESLHLAHEATEPVIDEFVTPALSKSIQAAYLRAKKASAAQNARSCRIVTEQRERRGHTAIDEVGSTLCGQTSILDY